MNHYEPPKWLKKQSKPFIELINKIPVNDTHAIIIEAASQAANLAFDQTYEVLIRLASGLPAQEEIIPEQNPIYEVLLELKNIFKDCFFTSQDLVVYLKNNPEKHEWFEEKIGQSCRSSTSLGGWLGHIAKKTKTNHKIKIEKHGVTTSMATLWGVDNA